MKKIIFIVGSRREHSFNKALSEAVAAIIKERVQISFLDYASIPLFNQDEEYPAPPEVQRVRDEIMAADGIWIFSPEYNFNIPGGLKNLLDWLSRPLVKDDPERITALTSMPVTFSGAGGKMGTGNVRKHLADFAVFARMKHMDGEETGIALTGEEFASDTFLLDEDRRKMLENQAERFLSFIGV